MEGYTTRHSCETDCDEPGASTHIESSADIAIARAWLTSQLYGSTSLPSLVGTLSTITDPLSLTGVSVCKKITFSEINDKPRVWYPSSPNGDLMIVHQGHGVGYTELNFDDIAQLLINDGFTVCGIVMVGGSETVGGNTSDHAGTTINQHVRQ